jgi:hypothetical protein
MTDIPTLADMYAQAAPAYKITQNRDDAARMIGMTPQERAFYDRHLMNLWGNGGVNNPDGSRSSLLQLNVEGPGGRAYNIPSVWNGQELNYDDPRGRAQIEANVRGAGGMKAFPSYATPEQADLRYLEQMHPTMDKDTGAYLDIRRNLSLMPPTVPSAVADLYRP